jgi:hypothetical protein
MLASCEMLRLDQIEGLPAIELGTFRRRLRAAQSASRRDFVMMSGSALGSEFPSITRELRDQNTRASGVLKYNFDEILLSNVNLGALSRVRELLNEQLEYYSASLDCLDGVLDLGDYPEGTWTFTTYDCAQIFTPGYEHLDAFVTQQSSLSGSTVVTCFDYVYRAGELVYQSFIDRVSWARDHFHSLVYGLRLVHSLIAELFRSGKGTAAITSLFVNERSWYLHHSAHPPEEAVKAVDGRFAAIVRRVRFRPQPA